MTFRPVKITALDKKYFKGLACFPLVKTCSEEAVMDGGQTPTLETQVGALDDLLAALPEMFPGFQEIPLPNIRPNPENPGPPITEQQIEELADNLKERGLVNPIRVQPDHQAPLAGGAQPHPQNPRLKADGKPWDLADFNFIVLTGENRYRSAGRLQWPTIKGTILNPTPLEAVEITHLDNATRNRGWWADYQSIERAIKAAPYLTQNQIATRLKLRLESVNWALGLLPLLNAEARALIIPIRNNSNKANKGISESAASWLADLGPGTGLKRGVRKKDPLAGSPSEPAQANQGPRLVASAQLDGSNTPKLWPYPPIPPETQDLVRRALVVAIDHQMIEAQVKRLVEAVKGGQRPEDYDPAKAKEGLNPSTGSGWATSTSSKRPTSPQPSPTPAGGNNSPTHTGFWKFLFDYAKQSLVKNLDHTIKHAFKRIVAQAVVSGVLFLILGLVVFLFFPRSQGRRMAWLPQMEPAPIGLQPRAVNTTRIQTAVEPPRAPSSPSTAQTTSGVGNNTLNQTASPNPTTVVGTLSSPSVAQTNSPTLTTANANMVLSGTGSAIGQTPEPAAAQTAPTPKPTALEKMASAHHPKSKKSKKKIKTASNQLTRMEKNARKALEFARHYYGYDYKNMGPWFDFMKNSIKDGMYDYFMSKHYPPDQLKHITERKFLMSFQPTQPVKFLEPDNVADYFLVEGTMTKRTDIHKPNELITQKPVAVEIGFVRETDEEEKVFYLEELSRDKAKRLLADSTGPALSLSQGSPQAGASASPQEDKTAKAVGDVLGEAAKKTLGF